MRRYAPSCLPLNLTRTVELRHRLRASRLAQLSTRAPHWQTGSPGGLLSPARRGPRRSITLSSVPASTGCGTQNTAVHSCFASPRRQVSSSSHNRRPNTGDPTESVTIPRLPGFPEEPYLLSHKKGPYGFFPMRLGQTLHDGRYKIVRKLGYGVNSSVWLARGRRDDGHRYVAVKVMSVNATLGEERGIMHEIAVAHNMSQLQESDKQHPGFRHCANIHEVFYEKSMHGTHACLVLDPYGPSLEVLLGASLTPGRFVPSVVKKVTLQVLLGLSFLHEKLQVVHADVKMANILVKLQASTEDIDCFLADHPALTYPDIPPDDENVSPEPIPAPKSLPLPFLGLAPSLKNLELSIVDYGTATRIDAKTPIFTPSSLRAPENILSHPWSYPVDIWAVGCLLFELLTGQDAFPRGDDPRTKEGHLASIYDRLGIFPTNFVQRCADGGKYIDDCGVPFGCSPDASVDGNILQTIVDSCYGKVSGKKELVDMCCFARGCFWTDPSGRPTASDLLTDDWLTY